MGYTNAKAEVLMCDGLFSVDILLYHRGLPVAIEVDGPSHYATNDANKALGKGLRSILLLCCSAATMV